MPNPHTHFRPNFLWLTLVFLSAPFWLFAYLRPSTAAAVTAESATGVLIIVAGRLVMRPMHKAMRRFKELEGAMCTTCGQDRRGLPTAAPCPECGAPEPTQPRSGDIP